MIRRDRMETLEEFRNYLLDLGQQSSTAHTNLKLIKKVLRECFPLSKENFQDYIKEYVRNGNERNYIKQIVIVTRYWAEYLGIEELKNYPYPKLKRVQTYKRGKFSEDEVDAILNINNPYKEGSLLWRRFELFKVFWHIGAYHGNRPGEAAKLRVFPTQKEPSTVDFGRNMLVFQAKNRTREVPISFVVRDILKTYVEEVVEGEYLFPALHKSQKPYIGDRAWQEDFKKRLRIVEPKFPNITKRLNLEPYSFRKSAATRWNNKNWSIRKIQEALGHSKLDTTQKYIDADVEQIQEMFDNDTLALRYKHGIEIIKHCIDTVRGVEALNNTKVIISTLKIQKSGKRVSIVIEAID